jgi:hypothetical protein
VAHGKTPAGGQATRVVIKERASRVGLRMCGFIQKNRFRQKQNTAKSTRWIPSVAGMTIFSA